jgi:hypothetical protein
MLDTSTIMITSMDTNIAMDMKLYVFSKNDGIEYASTDIVAKIDPVMSIESSTTSFISRDLNDGYSPMLIRNRNSNQAT